MNNFNSLYYLELTFLLTSLSPNLTDRFFTFLIQIPVDLITANDEQFFSRQRKKNKKNSIQLLNEKCSSRNHTKYNRDGILKKY